jgi:alkylation response protein AidB-like acyl-CoA dehydrogenase
MTTQPHSNGLAMAKSIESIITAGATEAEQLRTLPPATVDALWHSGLMHWMNPREAGGQEPSLVEMLETWLELSRQDATVGWIGIANFPSAAFAAAFLDDDGFKEVFTDNDNRITMGGQFAPNGMAEVVEGGYQLSGAWSFGSGTGHSQYVVGGFIPLRNGEMTFLENGMPEMLVAVMPRDQINFTDNWNVTGLKGTGSYDYNVQDTFVPEARVFPLFTREPKRGPDIFKLGVMPLTGAGHAAWALGVARSALDDIFQVAKEKTRMGDESTLGNKLTFQRDLAHHEAMWRAANAGVFEAYSRVEAQILAGQELTPTMRADMRISATYATEAAKDIVTFAHLAAGTTAIREGSRLERAFRDMYTGSQHAFINEKTYTDSARILMGLIEDAPGV